MRRRLRSYSRYFLAYWGCFCSFPILVGLWLSLVPGPGLDLRIVVAGGAVDLPIRAIWYRWPGVDPKRLCGGCLCLASC